MPTPESMSWAKGNSGNAACEGKDQGPLMMMMVVVVVA